MILTVTLNPALDVTYTVDALVPHATHRVTGVTERAGGKGLNVASVLHTLGEPVLATGLVGGATGATISDLADFPIDFVPVADVTRRTITVVDSADATSFSEPGPVVTTEEWRAFLAHYLTLVKRSDVVVLSGSLPRGLPVDAYATLVGLARPYTRSILDTSGDALTIGAAAGPDVVKPNAAEVAALGAHTAGAVVESHGSRGLIARTPAGVWRAVPPRVLTGNPTGAGDACAAALARGLRDGTPWPDLLADAVALASAAVAAPVAGAIDLTHYRSTKGRVHVQSHG